MTTKTPKFPRPEPDEEVGEVIETVKALRDPVSDKQYKILSLSPRMTLKVVGYLLDLEDCPCWK